MLRWVSIATLVSIQLCWSGWGASLRWHLLASGDDLNAVTFADGQFIAVGNNGRIYTSKDGIGWTLRNSSTNSSFDCVVAENDEIVAVGSVSVTSTNGLTWDLHATNGLSFVGRGVAYGNGLFVCVESGNGWTVNSTDGAVWTALNTGVSATFFGITYADGQFVAVGYDGIVTTSLDGMVWTGSTNASGINLFGVTYHNGLYVAVGGKAEVYLFGQHLGGTAGILVSADGKSWSLATPGTTNSLTAVTWGGGQYVAVGFSGTVLTSVDGTNWTAYDSGVTNKLYGVGYGNGRYVAVGAQGVILSSTNGVDWIRRTPGTAVQFSGVAYGQGLFVGGGNGGAILSSPDGTNWTQHGSGMAQDIYGVEYLNGQFYAPAGYVTLVSDDGTNWSITTNQSVVESIAYGNGQFVSTSGTGGITYGNGLFVVAAGPLETSPDGINWTYRYWTNENDLNGIVFGGNLFVAVGNGPSIVTSPDGTNWTTRFSLRASAGGLNAVGYGNGLFAAVGLNLEAKSIIYTSSDGASWTQTNPGNIGALNGVAYGKGLFVLVGANGTIMIGQPVVQLGPVTPLPDGTMQISVTGSPSQAYPIQASADLANWMTITNSSLSTNGTGQFIDPEATNYPHRFYRAVVP